MPTDARRSATTSLTFAISKVGAGDDRIVEGWATTSALDKQGDIVPFEVAVAAFERAASSLGIREMHQPVAVGVLRNWWPDPDNERIGVQVWLSESPDGESALTKCREGVLKGFSIGGICTKSHMTQATS
ncbi:MAG: hypothetical protein ACLQUT_07920 [Thermoleophilia bacterium]